MPLAAQAKLLTALERREVTPIGADKPEAIDVRIVSATNLDEVKLFDPAVFRPDLLFRLNTIVIRVPPLRERREDIPGLLRHYLDLYELQYQRPARAVDALVQAWLVQFSWPGNVRALRHSCERAVILGTGAEYGWADFGLPAAETSASSAGGNGAAPSVAGTAPRTTDDELTLSVLERDAIAAALGATNGNISHTARMLGVSRAALYRKLGKHGI
jgi:DNA-binding NtrC family response regulator